MNNNTLTLGSLFDGSGGFPLGGLLAGIEPKWASEIEPFPIRVTTKRLPLMRHYGDISALDGAKLLPVDIITFGSPCQDMSIAGKRAGLDGSRSNLFYEAIRIIKEMRCATNDRYPKTFGFMIHSSGKMCRARSPQTTEKISGQSSKASARSKVKLIYLDMINGTARERSWQTISQSHGGFLTLNTGECPSAESVSFLSQILTVGVPEKYYLSPKACLGILQRASRRGNGQQYF